MGRRPRIEKHPCTAVKIRPYPDEMMVHKLPQGFSVHAAPAFRRAESARSVVICLSIQIPVVNVCPLVVVKAVWILAYCQIYLAVVNKPFQPIIVFFEGVSHQPVSKPVHAYCPGGFSSASRQTSTCPPSRQSRLREGCQGKAPPVYEGLCSRWLCACNRYHNRPLCRCHTFHLP